MGHYDIVYIDDEPSMAVIFEQVINLKYRHWRAGAFIDSQEIYEQIINHQITANVWIIDLMMPQKTGVDIARAIREAGDTNAVLLGYTALDPLTLSRNPEYRDGIQLFSRIVGKQEGFIRVLAGIDSMSLRRTSK